MEESYRAAEELAELRQQGAGNGGEDAVAAAAANKAVRIVSYCVVRVVSYRIISNRISFLYVFMCYTYTSHPTHRLLCLYISALITHAMTAVVLSTVYYR